MDDHGLHTCTNSLRNAICSIVLDVPRWRLCFGRLYGPRARFGRSPPRWLHPLSIPSYCLLPPTSHYHAGPPPRPAATPAHGCRRHMGGLSTTSVGRAKGAAAAAAAAVACASTFDATAHAAAAVSAAPCGACPQGSRAGDRQHLSDCLTVAAAGLGGAFGLPTAADAMTAPAKVAVGGGGSSGEAAVATAPASGVSTLRGRWQLPRTAGGAVAHR